MRSCNKIFTITEYSGFTREIKVQGYQTLPEKTFDALEAFILANTNDTATEAVELLSLSVRRNIGKVITARNYVGLITMSDGTVIEILPKIADGEITVSETKQIFLEMLKTLNDVNFKDFNVSSLHTERLSLLEIFIKMFLDEVTILTKQGLKAAYTPIESNEKFYKGKLLASQNLKHNLVNKERFFVRYDDFNINRPENRLIKSTISFLLKATSDVRNRQLASRLLTYFDKVGFSTNYEGDLSRCFADRSVSHYQKVLSWCRVFLRGNSFTAFAGSEVALALLFPMEKVFESFIAARFRKHLSTGINIRTQDNRYSLFDSPSRAFALRPDIVLEFDGRTIVLDTKWKLLTDSARNKGISQSDMYQMYAYSKKYEAEGIVLVYPNSNLINRTNISFASDDNVKVSVSFIDLRNVEGSISKLVDDIVNVS
ncbi:MAG: McrC family protein [Bacteroidaceae bacterium]|jgi:5-methylcytosine-specific restriction enzyme subunit McrC